MPTKNPRYSRLVRSHDDFETNYNHFLSFCKISVLLDHCLWLWKVQKAFYEFNDMCTQIVPQNSSCFGSKPYCVLEYGIFVALCGKNKFILNHNPVMIYSGNAFLFSMFFMVTNSRFLSVNTKLCTVIVCWIIIK